jgi:hypothetical protein
MKKVFRQSFSAYYYLSKLHEHQFYQKVGEEYQLNKKGLNLYPAKSLIYLVGLDRLELSAN